MGTIRFRNHGVNTKGLRVAVIGGGIGGLTAAIALRRVGAEVRVYERAPAIKEVGAGLSVWANAVRVLDALGVGDRLRSRAEPMTVLGLYSADGRRLSMADIAARTAKRGTPSFLMHRAELQGALLESLPDGVVVTGAECASVAETKEGAAVQFKDGASAHADVVIGADGFNSVVRRQLWGNTPARYSGQTCYRGVVRMPIARPGLLAEIYGRGVRLGLGPIAPDRMYWFACHNASRDQPEDPRGAKAKLLDLFRGWPMGVADVIAATPDEAILRNDLCDRAPLRRWNRGPVTLLGDAAHPMTPNLGQGACAAIEDAAVLARCVREEADIASALKRYGAARIPRTTRLAELSARFGRWACWSHPAMVGLRSTLLRWAPAPLMRRELDWQYDFDAGAGALAVGASAR